MTSLTIILFLLLQMLTVCSFDLGADIEDSFFEITLDRDHPDKIYKEFKEFMVKYKRSYKDEIEKKFRFQQFSRTHNHVKKMNTEAEKKGHDTKYGINKFSDRSKQEIHSMYTKYPPTNQTNVPVLDLKSLRIKRQMDGLPVNFDLRNKKIGGRYVVSGEVKNQASCSCCWAFAATALAEIALSVHLKNMTTLSDQEVCDCAAKHGPGCSGGLPEDGLEYIKDMGLTTDEEYPYFEKRATVEGRCDAHEYDRELNPYTLTYYQIDPFNAEHQMTRHLFYFNVPIAVAFRTGASLSSYDSGILQLTDCDDAKEQHWHSGVVIGYGTKKEDAPGKKAKKVDYWIFKNSWAGDWGEAGFARIARGDDWCSIESHGYGARIPE